jgi:hypothetical protein
LKVIRSSREDIGERERKRGVFQGGFGGNWIRQTLNKITLSPGTTMFLPFHRAKMPGIFTPFRTPTAPTTKPLD